MTYGIGPHGPRKIELDAWLIGYNSFAPSPVHVAAEIGEAGGLHGPPTVDTWRVMQASALATDVGLASLAFAIAKEGFSPAATRGLSWYATRFALARYLRYARFAAGPFGIGGFFALEALKNWTPGKATPRNPRTGRDAVTIQFG